MTARVDDDTLVAYLDGELAEAEAREVEAALAADPRLAEDARLLREGAAAVRAAFADPLRAPVPGRLVEAIDTTFAERAQAARRGRGPSGGPLIRRQLFGAIAASIAALVVGLSGAYFIAEYQVERRIARLEAVRAADRQMIQAAVSLALEKHLSGIPAHWRNPDSGSSGRVEPIRTFRISTGQWCREYVQVFELRDGQERRETRRAIACREADGTWKTRLELTDES